MDNDFNDIMTRLSENAKFALQKADLFSKKYGNGYMGTEHILMGIAAQDASRGAQFLRDFDVTLTRLEDALGQEAQDVQDGGSMAMMSLSEAAVLTLRMADSFALAHNSDIIGTINLLDAMFKQPNSRAAILLNQLGVNEMDFGAALESEYRVMMQRERNLELKKEFKRSGQLKWLKRYGQDLTELAKENKLDTVIGRDREIERVVTVLSRRTKSNPVLIGEAGVGKTAIVEGLAERIVKNDVPAALIGRRIYQVDLSNLVAGTKFRGEFEERIKGVIDEAIKNEDVILFIDELHLLTGAGAGEGSMDAANILKPALARGQIQLIGATTMDEYHKQIENDKALSRRFQTVIVEEPSPEVTLKILKGIKKHYEKHHGVEIPDEMLELAINMSGRYINDRYMPDKVIDVLDEAAAIRKVKADHENGSAYKKLKIEAQEVRNKMEEMADKEDFEAAEFCQEKLKGLEKELKKAEKIEQKTPVLTEDDLALAISLKTNIPVAKVHGSEAEALSNLEGHLKKSVVGQNEAVASVAKAIRRGRSGIANPNRPIGSFLFMGPTGVGKTELARVVAREVFGGENALIKIDMSEFGEKHNVSRLVGAPAGYVGYEDGGKLTEAVRRHPYSVVLFDEIEKAHPDVFNMLLQILEDGCLTDGQGNRVKFNNTVVILTSNLGADEMYRESELGFAVKNRKEKRELEVEYEASKATAMRALKKVMKPELINRLDAILVFRALTHDNVERIFDNLLEELKKRLATKHLGVKVSPEVKEYIIEQGYDPKNGARPLRRMIEDKIESLIADKMIAGELGEGNIAEIQLQDKDTGELTLKVTNG